MEASARQLGDSCMRWMMHGYGRMKRSKCRHSVFPMISRDEFDDNGSETRSRYQ